MKLTLETLHHYGEEEGDCLLWKYSVGSHGYPQACLDGKPGSIVRTYIFTQLLGNVIEKKGGRLSSVCMNKKCIAPGHIVVKSPSKIQKDVYRLGIRNPLVEAANRRSSAPICGHARISDEAVQAIKASDPNMNHTQVAKDFGVSRSSVSAIRRGRRYGMLPTSSIFNWAQSQ